MPVDHSPAFGQADLSNCERELIHLAGSVQPHGILLVVDEADGTVVQASANSTGLLGLTGSVLGLPLTAWLGAQLGWRPMFAALGGLGLVVALTIALLLPVIIIGGIYSGYFRPTESAAVALAYALFRHLKGQDPQHWLASTWRLTL